MCELVSTVSVDFLLQFCELVKFRNAVMNFPFQVVRRRQLALVVPKVHRRCFSASTPSIPSSLPMQQCDCKGCIPAYRKLPDMTLAPVWFGKRLQAVGWRRWSRIWRRIWSVATWISRMLPTPRFQFS
jgi:hypothetical protein